MPAILFWFLCFSTFCSVIWRRVIHKWWDNSKVADEYLPAPANITIAKGCVYMAVTWDFVNFTINSDVSKTFLEWVKYTRNPEETYFATLNMNPLIGTPGAFTGKAFPLVISSSVSITRKNMFRMTTKASKFQITGPFMRGIHRW